MKQFRKILFCTDFSENSDNALKYATQISGDLDAQLTVLHAYRLIQPSVPLNDSSPYSIKNQWEKASWEQLHQLEKKYLKASGIKYDFELGMGFATDAIVDYIESNEPDLLIIGNNGRGNISRLFGSTTEELLDRASCPILVVPMEADYEEGIKNAVMAYNFEEIKDESGLLGITDVLRELNISLDIVKVFPHGENFKLNGESKAFEAYLTGIMHEFNLVEGEDVEQSILEYIEKRPVDLLITFHKKHTLLENVLNMSITRKLSLHSQVPLLTFREK